MPIPSRTNLPSAKRKSIDELLSELEKIQISFDEVEDDNDQLQAEIERYKDMVRALSNQNQELIDELDKISEQDESARSILNRKARIDSLINKAEATVSRNQIGKY
jgi:chromosome segregation ATPase